MRQIDTPPDPAAAREWREFARYLLRLALDPPIMPGAERDAELRAIRTRLDAAAAAELREIAEALDHEGARRALEALDAAAEGRPFEPYSDRKARRGE